MQGVSKRLSKKMGHGAKAILVLYRAGLVATSEVHEVIVGRALMQKRWVNVAYRRMTQMQVARSVVVLPYDMMCDKYNLCWHELTRWQGY